MKKVKSFNYRIGACAIDDVTEEVNEYSKELSKKGIEDIEVLVNSTSIGLTYTLVWDEK